MFLVLVVKLQARERTLPPSGSTPRGLYRLMVGLCIFFANRFVNIRRTNNVKEDEASRALGDPRQLSRWLTQVEVDAPPTLSDGFIRDYISPGTTYVPGLRHSKTPATREHSPVWTPESVEGNWSLGNNPYTLGVILLAQTFRILIVLKIWVFLVLPTERCPSPRPGPPQSKERHRLLGDCAGLTISFRIQPIQLVPRGRLQMPHEPPKE